MNCVSRQKKERKINNRNQTCRPCDNLVYTIINSRLPKSIPREIPSKMRLCFEEIESEPDFCRAQPKKLSRLVN